MKGVKAKKWEGVQEVVYYVSALLLSFSWTDIGLFILRVKCPTIVLV